MTLDVHSGPILTYELYASIVFDCNLHIHIQADLYAHMSSGACGVQRKASGPLERVLQLEQQEVDQDIAQCPVVIPLSKDTVNPLRLPTSLQASSNSSVFLRLMQYGAVSK
ncbi:hypothetical protein STEG23_031971, partial [Scotinomys teguina]